MSRGWLGKNSCLSLFFECDAREAAQLLLSEDSTVREQGKARLIEMGPPAVVPVIKVMQAHIGDKDETAWRLAYDTLEHIVQKHRDDPHLDDGLTRLPPLEAKTARFAGVDFVWISEGWFAAGTSIKRDPRDVPDTWRGELRRVWLDGYWISRTELTNAICDEAGLLRESRLEVKRLPELPAFTIVPGEAQKFCAWFSERIKDQGLQAVIPTDDQWEKAARGTDGRLYPWGNHRLRGRKALFWSHREDGGCPAPRPVGTLPIDTSPYGVKDMAGNVAELARRDEATPLGDKLLYKWGKIVQPRRGQGFHPDIVEEDMIPYLTPGYPVGMRIVLIRLDSERTKKEP